MKLHKGDAAPPFSVLDQTRKEKTLGSYGGQWLLLYFYPKDFTTGCTVEACAFRDRFEDFKSKLAVVGVSADSVESHQSFAEKHSLPFTLLADTDRTMAMAYGVNGIMFSKRTSFLIDPRGKIQKVYASVKPGRHPVQILSDVTALTSPVAAR